MKSSFKFIAIFLSIFFLLNCSHETTTDADTQSISTREFKMGSVENFPKLQKSLEKIEKNGLSRKSGKSTDKYVIDKSTIIEIKDKDSYYYTAKIKDGSDCEGCFKNIVINNPNTDEANALLVTYHPDEDYMIRQKSSHRTYITGKVSFEKIPIDDVDFSKEISQLDKKSGDCITLYITMCSWEYDHVAQNTCFEGTHLYTVWITDCSGGGPHQGDLPPPDNNNGGVSPGNNAPGGGTYPLSTPNPFGLTTTLSLNNAQANWLDARPLEASEIRNFLDTYGISQDIQNMAKNAIVLLMNGMEVGSGNSNFIDEEPVKEYIGTASDFKNLLNNSPRGVGKFKGKEASDYLKSLGETKFNFKQMRPLPTQTGFFNSKKGRYIYTKKGGWLDMAHFMFYAGRAYEYKLKGENDPIGEAVQDGFRQEFSDSFVAKHSAYSYEDLPSDKYGAEFAVNYFSSASNLTFAEQLYSYLVNVLESSQPENAPNFNDLPAKDTRNKPTKINKTTKPLYTQ